MIDLYYWTTPNGHKISIMLEEAKLAYRVKPINIGRGEQFDPEFLTIAPITASPPLWITHRRMAASPRCLSLAPFWNTSPIRAVFLPAAGRERYIVLQWLHWQMGA